MTRSASSLRRPTAGGLVLPSTLAILSALVAISCSDDPTAVPPAPRSEPAPPATGSLVVVIAAGSADVDLDGYTVVLNGTARGKLFTGSSMVFPDMTPGDLMVGLEDIAANCVVREAAPRVVRIIAHQVTTALFTAVCLPEQTGGIRVRLMTPGFDRYSAAVDGGRAVQARDGFVLLTDVAPGTRAVRLVMDASPCQIHGQNPQAITVEAGRFADAFFSLVCPIPAGSLVATVNTTGPNQPSSFSIMVTEMDDLYCYTYTCRYANVGATGSVRFDGLRLRKHYVELRAVPRHCAATPQYVNNVPIRADSIAHVAFSVVCS